MRFYAKRSDDASEKRPHQWFSRLLTDALRNSQPSRDNDSKARFVAHLLKPSAAEGDVA